MRAANPRALGRSALKVSQLGFGGAPLGNLFAELSEADAAAAVAGALASGIRLFDTAPLYGHGLSEHRIGAMLRHYRRDEFVVATKVGRLLRADPVADGGLYRRVLPFSTASCRSASSGILRSSLSDRSTRASWRPAPSPERPTTTSRRHQR